MGNFIELFLAGIIWAGIPSYLICALGLYFYKNSFSGFKWGASFIVIGGFLGWIGCGPVLVMVAALTLKDDIRPLLKGKRFKENYLEEINKLGELKEKGVLTEDEFLTQKKKILENVQTTTSPLRR